MYHSYPHSSFLIYNYQPFKLLGWKSSPWQGEVLPSPPLCKCDIVPKFCISKPSKYLLQNRCIYLCASSANICAKTIANHLQNICDIVPKCPSLRNQPSFPVFKSLVSILQWSREITRYHHRTIQCLNPLIHTLVPWPTKPLIFGKTEDYRLDFQSDCSDDNLGSAVIWAFTPSTPCFSLIILPVWSNPPCR